MEGTKMSDWFISQWGKGDTRIGGNEAIENSIYLSHGCPFCGNKGSNFRAITWIVDSCVRQGSALFPCDECNEYINFPSQVFKEGFFEKVFFR